MKVKAFIEYNTRCSSQCDYFRLRLLASFSRVVKNFATSFEAT